MVYKYTHAQISQWAWAWAWAYIIKTTAAVRKWKISGFFVHKDPGSIPSVIFVVYYVTLKQSIIRFIYILKIIPNLFKRRK